MEIETIADQGSDLKGILWLFSILVPMLWVAFHYRRTARFFHFAVVMTVGLAGLLIFAYAKGVLQTAYVENVFLALVSLAVSVYHYKRKLRGVPK